MAPSINDLLREYVQCGKLDCHTTVEILSDSEVMVLNLRAAQLHSGIGREFLRAMKGLNLFVHIDHPVRDALPFWRQMWKEGLVADDPDAQPTWEDFLTGLESQMVTDKGTARSHIAVIDQDVP
ncbi:MAG: hypothetical protein WCA95_00105 [Opitutaceae bacterium]|jgi:hypothetical protein